MYITKFTETNYMYMYMYTVLWWLLGFFNSQATQHDLFISFILVLLLSYTALCKCYHNHDIIKNCDYLSSTIMIPKNHNRLALWTATGNVSMWNTVYGKFELQYSHTCMSKSKYTSRCQVHVVIIITINLQQCIIHDIIIYYPTI